MRRLAIPLLLLVCFLAISAAAADLHCIAMHPSSASIVLVCSANRLEAQR